MMDVTRRESGTRTRKRDVVFLTAKLGSSRATTKSEYHSSSNIIAIYKQSKTTICGKSHKFSQLKEEHGGFLSGVERKHKNERTATRQRATLHNGVARCVFSSPRCTRCTRIPWAKAQTHSHLARRFPPYAPRHEITDRLKLKRTRGKTKQRPTFARFSPAKSRNAPAFSHRP